MKIVTILFIVGLIMSPVIGLAQTSNTSISPIQPTATVTSPQTTAASLSSTKCGVNTFMVYNECGANVYKNVYAQCYDGFEVALGEATSCKLAETWDQYTKEACANHCSTGIESTVISKPLPKPESASVSAPTPAIGGGGGGSVSPTPTLSIQPTTTVTSPQTTAASLSSTKCGVNTFMVYNECGAGVYKNVYAQCYDGYETDLGAVESSCKSAETWSQYAKETCANHCSTGVESPIVSKPLPIPTPTISRGTTGGGGGAALVSSTPAPKPIFVCYISDNLMQEYNQLILDLQKSESDIIRAEEITQQIIVLKQEITKQQKECANTSPQPVLTTASQSVPIASPIVIENKPVVVSADHCNEVAQWETKIAYYKKLRGLSDTDLKNGGFLREEIEKILQELSLGLEKVSAQCSGQSATITAPPTAITGLMSIAETVKPVVIESGQAIGVYYKARIEKAVSIKGEEKQIEELKTLRDEIDGLIANLIKSRKELEIKELDTLVKEVKVSRGEIKADDIVVKTTDKKILINIGDRPVSVEPTANQVLIQDKGLEVSTDEVMIKENVLSVGGVDVKMSASEVAEKLNIAPKTIELKEKNAKTFYNMKIDERRKLFGFIPFNIQKIVVADAENGNALSEHLPWYGFLTTK